VLVPGVLVPVEVVPEVVPVEDVPVEEVAPVAAALLLEDVLDEPPQAARPTQASNKISSAATAGLRLRVVMWGMELLCR
jgi:hypothetical protein